MDRLSGQDIRDCFPSLLEPAAPGGAPRVRAVFDVTMYPLFQQRLAGVPELDRYGPLVSDEHGRAVRRRYYWDLYREVADAAGVPRTLDLPGCLDLAQVLERMTLRVPQPMRRAWKAARPKKTGHV